jgi:SGNH domain (fused to AT3 domains)
MLVVGDSVGRTFGVGLKSWAQATGGATVVDDARDWCSLGRYLPRDVYGPQNSTAGCDDWGTRWANDIRTFDPDVVFVMFTIWEVVPRVLPGTTTDAQPGDPALDAWQLSEYQKAADVLSARGARVVWFSTACEGPKPIVRGEPLWYVNRRTVPALARSRPSVRLIDLDGLLCNGPHLVVDFGGVRDIRPDRAHYSPAGARAIAGWVMPIVLGKTRPPPYAAN